MFFETYIERQKRLRGETTDVFTYDPIPKEFRVQTIRIWRDSIGEPFSAGARTVAYDVYKELHERIADEFGKSHLLDPRFDAYQSLTGYFEHVANTEQCLTIIELVFNVIPNLHMIPGWHHAYYGTVISPEEANNNLNSRFLRHGLGYQLVGTKPALIVRKDNEHLHTETVLPALSLLHDLKFKGADDEYRSAHEHYRHQRYEECLVDCLKAFESTMKTICDLRQWPYDPSKATASALIDVCLNNGLLPAFTSSHLKSIGACLKDGAPTMRNKTAGHGTGATPRTVPKLYAEYMIHETAVNILLLAEAYKDLPSSA